MSYVAVKKFRCSIVLLWAILILTSIIIGIFLSGYTANNGSNFVAEAAVPAINSRLITNRGLNIYDTDFFRGIYTYDNLLTTQNHSNSNGTTYGDYCFLGMGGEISTSLSYEGIPVNSKVKVPKGENRSYDATNATTYDEYTYHGFSYKNLNQPIETAQISIAVPIIVGSNLYKAINDTMLDVKINAYAQMLNFDQGSGTDYARSTLTYNNGVVSIPKEKTVSFLETPYSDSEYEYSMSDTVTMSSCYSGAYVSLTFDNFDKRGDNISIIISKLAFRITVTKKDFKFKSPEEGDVVVIDADGTRDSLATTDMVKRGDIIFITTYLQFNESFFTINNGTVGDNNLTGKFYRNLMLNSEIGSARTSTTTLLGTDYLIEGVSTYTNNDMVTWLYDKSALTRIYTFVDNSGVSQDLTYGYTALSAAFYVNDSTKESVNIKCSMKDSYGNVVLGENDMNGEDSGRNYSYIIDSQLPNAPNLSSSSIFYDKYINSKSYYTNAAGYNYENDILENRQIKGVTIGSQSEGSDAIMSDQTTLLQGLSSEIVYYRATRLEREPNNYTAELFTREQADGIYCVTTPTLTMLNGKFVMTGKSTVYQGMDLLLRMGDSPETYTYPKQGIYKVEFITYDYVGNISANSSAVILRVDVANYNFDVVTKVGSTEVSSLTAETFSLSYYALNDNNDLEPRNNATFKRGDKIVLKLDFTATGYSNYVLTYFRTPVGFALNTSDFPYDNYDAIYLTNKSQSTSIPTFTLDGNYSGDDKADNRKLILTFKMRALISVTNTTQIYEEGTPRSVATIATVGGKKITNITIITTYSENIDGPFRAMTDDFPMNAGTYYYKSELTSTNYHGYVTNKMTIVPAMPTITELKILAIDYGNSLAVRDTVYNEQLGRFVMSDSIFCSYTYFDEETNSNRKISVYNRSSDGVFGYFSIIDPSKSSTNYSKPSAGTTKVKILFTPIIMQDQYTPLYNNGNFVVNSNYFPVTISDITLVVNHSTDVNKTVANVNEEGLVVTDYSGVGQNIEVDISAMDDGRTILLNNYLVYTFTNQETSTTTAVLPTNAGVYTVNYSLNTNLCNYSGSWTQELVINKRQLIVFCDNVLSEFQRELRPNPVSKYYYAGGVDDYIGLTYQYTYYYYDSEKTNLQMAVEENEVPNIPQAMFNNLPWVAGKYLVKVSILDTNLENESDCFITYTINRVSSLGSSYLKAEFPNLNWTSATSGYHLNYLQPLKAISIATNQDTEVLYSHHYMDLGKVKYRWEQISGRFLVAYSLYTGDFSTQSVADFVYEQEEYDELNVGAHSLYLYFVPSNENLTNFNLIYIAYNVNVGKAQPIFYDIVATPITYGKTINSIDDVNLSKDAAAQKAVKFKLYEDQNGTHYHYMSEEEYTYSLYTVANPLLPAGINNIIITFSPVDNVNYEQANGTVAVVVNKRVVDISFEKNARYDEANDIYIYPYRAYVNAAPLLNAEQLVKSTDDPQGSYAVFEYDETNVSGGYKGASYTSSILATGKYRIDYTINDPNYSGSNYYYVEITKDSLRRSADPLISLAATAVSYGKLMSAVSFIGGSMISSSSNAKIEGTYYLNYPAGTVFQVMGQQNLKLKFVPNDTENYLVYEGDSNGDYNINVFVSRADISAELTLEVRNDYTYGDLAHDWNFTDTSYTSNIFTNGVNFASSKLDESYRYIDGTYSINSRPMTGYFNAGTYNVTFTVNEDPTFQKYYTGSVTVPLTIAKKKAVMAVENNVKVFNNKAQGLDVAVFLAQIDGENVTPGVRLSESVVQTFYKNGVKMNARPSAIGLYTVEITLQSINYEYYYAEKLQSEFTIKVDSDQIVITNLNQLYSVQRAIGISLGINSAVYTIKYYDINTLTEYSNLPINSGMYEVKLIFDSASNNGYEETIVYKDLLIIDKYTANIITSNVVSTLYSGKSNIISVRTEPYNLQFITTYRKQGETEFTLDEAINANTGNGYHEVKFVIDNNNYKGEKIIRYYILPSTLTVESHPTFNNYVYNTDIQPEINSRGIVRFGYDEIIENGVYEIPLGNIKYLDVGTYNVGYNFIAYNQFGEVDTNYQMASGVCKVVITKQNIDSANIIISDDIPLSVNYNTGYHYVYANLCKGLGQCDCSAHYDASNIDKDGLIYNIYSNNKDFSIRIKYNNSSTPALSLGEYTISAEIVSKNYTGNVVFDKKLIVFKGTPEIRVKPSIKESVSLNIVYDGTNYVYPTVSTNDIKAGEAFIQDTQIRISGTFTVIEGQNLTRANINHLNVLFTPFDTNFNPSTIIIDVNVMGVNPLSGISNDKNADWTDVSITSNIEESYQSVTIAARPIASSNYGAQLQDFELYFANESDGTENNYYSDFGYLSFINPLYVPNVGEKVSVKFTPYDSQNRLYGYVYNEMKGMLSLPLTKADMAESVSFYLKGFENKALATDMVFEIIDGDSILSIYDGAFTIYTDETKTELFDMDSPIFYENVVNNQVYIVYTSNNYNDVEFYTTIEVYNRINESDINIMYLSKEYSEDTGIVISDLSPQVNLAGNISQEYMQLIITDSNGDISEGKEIGIYRITLIIDNGEYYGTKEISDFSVVRKDISEDIQLSELSSDYGDFEEPTVLYNGGTLDIDYYTLMYKISTAPDTSYSRNITEDANSYNVHINIDTYNYFASKVFTYVIKPIKVRVFAMNKEVTYASLDVNDAPEVSFKLLNSEEALTLKYTLYYYNDNYTITTQKPSDVGAYKVKMIIDDTNYVPDANDTYVEFNYTITQATVIITTVPSVLSTMAEDGSVYNIKYGQALSDVKIIGGEARRNNVPVAGSFSVGNSAVRPSAGSYIMTIVFTPYNSNYASAEVNSQITVARGDAQVIVDNLYAKYDGISKKNWIQVTVQPSGVQVAISYTNSKGNVIAEPTNAGTYYINATSLNNNYNVTISRSADGSMTPRLVIVKAKVQTIDNGYNVNNPNALNIMAGDSLAKSSLTGGEVYYEGFTNAVQGKFTYLQSALIFDTAGVHTTGYIFTPDDINNFDTYQGIIEITVNKAYATITVTNTDFVYGEGFTMPKFTTNPIGLSYEHNITFTEYDPSGAYNSFDVIPAGTYEFEVWITSPNYARDDNNLVFFIHIAKKEIDIDFINENGDVVTQYKTTYGVPLETAIKLYSQNNNQGKMGYLLKDEIVNDVIISERKTTRYVSTDKGVYYDSQVVPKERGGYEVTVSLRNDNYTASRTVTYVIERGFIEEIFFDTNTLENVRYGDVKVPIIYTRPSDISYYIVYHGHGTTRPKDAGSYDITVYFDDDNYEKKQVTAMFKINPLKISINQITVKDKVYDGVSGLEINGKLNGVRLGDEVDLVLKATTLDDDVSVGAHYVDITEYSLKGLHAKNYIVEKPIYYGQVNIFTKVISANSSKSYITSSTGFRAGTTVEIVEIDDKNNKTNIFTKAIGVESTVIGYSLKENGKETSINEPIKVYIAIPKQYLNTDFVVKPADKLSGQTISFRREGNYITFDTTSSGSVAFEKTEFKYGFAVTVISVVVIIIGIFVLFVLNPVHRKSKTSDRTMEKRVIKRIRRGY